MPDRFAGVEDFVAALTGGGAIEQAGYDAGTRRVMQEASRRALFEKRLEDAAKARIITDAYRNLQANEPPGRNTDILISNLGGSFANLQRGLGIEQVNTVRQAQIDEIAAAALQGRDVNYDLFNPSLAVTANRPMVPANVDIAGQAEAIIGKTNAQASKFNADAEYSSYRKNEIDAKVNELETRAGFNTARAEAATAKAAAPGGKARHFNTAEVGMLFPPDDSGQFTEFQEFTKWQVEQARSDPRFTDDNFAYSMWKNGTDANTLRSAKLKEDAVAAVFAASRGEASQGAATASAPPIQRAPVPASPTLPEAAAPAYPNSEDGKILIEAAQQAINEGRDPQAVMKILERELAKIGLTLQK